VTISRASSSYNTDRHTYIYQVGFETAKDGLCAEQFTDNAVFSSVRTSSVSVLGHKIHFMFGILVYSDPFEWATCKLRLIAVQMFVCLEVAVKLC
jgi:hypothetical protein